MTAVNPLPNILTWIRLIAGLIMFTLLAGAAGGFRSSPTSWWSTASST